MPKKEPFCLDSEIRTHSAWSQTTNATIKHHIQKSELQAGFEPDCPFSYQSMMLEVNKRTYMEDGSLRLIGTNNHKRDVRDIMNTILSELEM